MFTDDRAIPPKKKHARTACNGTVLPKTATEIDLVFSFLFLVLFVVPPSPSVQFLSCFWHLFNCVLFLSVFFRPLSSVPFFSVAFFLCFAPHSNVFQRSVRRCGQQGQPVFAWFGLLKILHAYFLRWQEFTETALFLSEPCCSIIIKKLASKNPKKSVTITEIPLGSLVWLCSWHFLHEKRYNLQKKTGFFWRFRQTTKNNNKNSLQVLDFSSPFVKSGWVATVLLTGGSEQLGCCLNMFGDIEENKPDSGPSTR